MACNAVASHQMTFPASVSGVPITWEAWRPAGL